MLKLFKFLKFMFKFFFNFKCTCRPYYTFLLFYFLSKIFLLVLIRRVWFFSEPSSNNHIIERDKSGQPLGTEWALFQVLIPVWPQCSGCWIPRQNNVTQTKRASLVLVSTTIRGIKINFRNRFLYCQVRLFTNTDGRARPARGASGAVWEQRSTRKLLKNYKKSKKRKQNVKKWSLTRNCLKTVWKTYCRKTRREILKKGRKSFFSRSCRIDVDSTHGRVKISVISKVLRRKNSNLKRS